MTPEKIDGYGYIREQGSQIEKWKMHRTTYEDLTAVQTAYQSCIAPLDPYDATQSAKLYDCLKPYNLSDSMYRNEPSLQIWSTPSDSPQVYCELIPTQHGFDVTMSHYFD